MRSLFELCKIFRRPAILSMACLMLLTTFEVFAARDPLADRQGSIILPAVFVGSGGIPYKEYLYKLRDYAAGRGQKMEQVSFEERRKILKDAIEDELVYQEAVTKGFLNQKRVLKKLAEYYADGENKNRLEKLRKEFKELGDEELMLREAVGRGIHDAFPDFRRWVIDVYPDIMVLMRDMIIKEARSKYKVTVKEELLGFPLEASPE